MRHSVGIRVWCGKVCNLRLWRVLVNAALAGYWRFGWLDLGASKRTNADFYRASRGVRCLGACGAAATVAEARCLFRRRAVPGPGGTSTQHYVYRRRAGRPKIENFENFENYRGKIEKSETQIENPPPEIEN